MNILFLLGVILLSGLIFGGLFKLIKLPEVTGYLIAGIVIGPYVLNLINFKEIASLETFSTIALSFISFSIGAEFKLKYLKKLGIKPFIIGIMASFLTMAFVSYTFLFLGLSPSFSIILGAIASSTAPASIMMIVKEYKARGELTNTMLSVIAIDDVISIVIFGFSICLAEYLNSNNTSLIGLLSPFKEIGLSLIIGVITGLLLGISSKLLKSNSNIIALIIVFIFGSIVISDYYHISSLLVCMIMGCVFINAYNHKITLKILDLIDYISPPICIIFFVLSGSSLDFSLIPTIGFIGMIYIIMRTLGKILGSMLGAKLVNSPKKVYKYLGPTLLSQTGLAIGLAIEAVDTIPNESKTLIAIIVASSFLFDLIGPIITKCMLKKSGEIKNQKRLESLI